MRRARRLLAVVLGVLLAVPPAEVVLRATQRIPEPGERAWAARPHSRLVCESAPDEFRAVHRYNRYGFRGPDFAVEPDGRVRIACVGDSYTEGVGVEEHEAWPARLAERLGDGVEVLNLGDGGSQLDRYARIVAEAALPLRPEHVVVGVLPGDLRFAPQLPAGLAPLDALPDPFREDRTALGRALVRVVPGWVRMFDRLGGRGRVQTGSMWRPLDEGRLVADVARQVADDEGLPQAQAREVVRARLARVDPAVRTAAREGRYNSGFVELELRLPNLLYRHRLTDLLADPATIAERTDAWLAWYAGACRDAGAEPWLAYLPVAPLVRSGPFGCFADAHYADAPEIVGDSSVRDLLRAACEAHGVGFVDTTPALARPGAERLFHRFDTHPTAAAQARFAATIGEALRPATGPGRGAGER